MINIVNKVDCCGCEACYNACPNESIRMKSDEEGFLYPQVNQDTCVNCGLCEKVCPISNCETKKNENQVAYLLQYKDDEVCKESTSGGAFTGIASYVIEKGGIVFGVEMTEEYKVRHTSVETIEELKRFRNSKYVQSRVGYAFQQVRNELKRGRMVCFSGTPCQIEGLRHFLGKDYQNLILVDGDMSILSFHATKVYNTIEGGAICYNDEEYKTKLYRLRDFGIASEEIVDAVGANAKMNEFCAAMGLCNLKYVNQEIEKRKEIVNRYRENLNNVDGIKLLPVQKDVVANYSYFPIVINEKDFGSTRNEVFEKLKDNNIFARKYFYPLTSQFDCYHGRYNNATPVALHISKRVLTLPLYADLCLKDVDTICRVITSCKK